MVSQMMEMVRMVGQNFARRLRFNRRTGESPALSAGLWLCQSFLLALPSFHSSLFPSSVSNVVSPYRSASAPLIVANLSQSLLLLGISSLDPFATLLQVSLHSHDNPNRPKSMTVTTSSSNGTYAGHLSNGDPTSLSKTYKPTHPELFEVQFEEGSYNSSLVTKRSFRKGEVLCPLGDRSIESKVKRYSTVQVGSDKHIELCSE